VHQLIFYNKLLRFEHVDGYDFKPKQATIDAIKAESEKQSESEIMFNPRAYYPTFAVLTIELYKSYRQKFSNPTGKYSKHIIDCSQRCEVCNHKCVARDIIGIVSNNHFGDCIF